MDAAASPAPDSTRLAELQRAAQLKLGGCLLRLQQYERLLKAMVASTDLAGEPGQLQALRDARVASVNKTTLGGLVTLFTGGYLRAEDEPASAQERDDTASGDRLWFSFQQRMEISAERLEAITAELKELVELRNELVHHLLERFDLGQLDRSEAAVAYLDDSRATIDRHYQTLCSWAKGMDNVRASAASFMQSDAFKDFLINGIAPDGQVGWLASGIVRGLRAAEQALAPTGSQGHWVELNAAITWIAKQHPGQNPKRYGCSSWRQVLHESREFEVMKKPAPAPNTSAGTTTTTGSVVCYRSRREDQT
ncbi:OST-HTH/LOTUS domain-containing protein [Acidovorax sp. LjRoot194]|uniref:OST-HTH/LOTUS domain-containing protein n=1 Tax=Acidovorax sp. LjRoot194 TaxID=3342280 RepID=UPI003ECD24F7